MKSQHISITELGQYNGVQENNFIYTDNYNKAEKMQNYCGMIVQIITVMLQAEKTYLLQIFHYLNFGTERNQIKIANTCFNSVQKD
jgi:hypothetical protein